MEGGGLGLIAVQLHSGSHCSGCRTQRGICKGPPGGGLVGSVGDCVDDSVSFGSLKISKTCFLFHTKITAFHLIISTTCTGTTELLQ